MSETCDNCHKPLETFECRLCDRSHGNTTLCIPCAVELGRMELNENNEIVNIAR